MQWIFVKITKGKKVIILDIFLLSNNCISECRKHFTLTEAFFTEAERPFIAEEPSFTVAKTTGGRSFGKNVFSKVLRTKLSENFPHPFSPKQSFPNQTLGSNWAVVVAQFSSDTGRSAVRIQSSSILLTINCIEKMQVKKKEAGNGPIKKHLNQITVV